MGLLKGEVGDYLQAVNLSVVAGAVLGQGPDLVHGLRLVAVVVRDSEQGPGHLALDPHPEEGEACVGTS